MCFSAEASFGVSAVLLPAGLYCVRAAVRKNPAYLPLALFPVLCSVQQFFEGLVWVGLGHDDPDLVQVASLVFLFFAFFFWLFWIPWSVRFIETRRMASQFLGVVAFFGLAMGALLYLPVALDPDGRLRVGIVHHSIRYDCDSLTAFESVPRELGHLLYLAVVCSPLIVSGHRPFRLFALTLALSAVVTHFVFWYAYDSVWCFFAAALSLQLCYVLRTLPGSEGRQTPDA